MARFKIHQPLLHQLPIQYIFIVPVLLALLAAYTFTVHGDVNAPLLYSQCHARSRLPELSHIPVLGAPLCFLVSTIMLAADSMRGVAELGVCLAFLGTLLTICRIEAARACNQRSFTVRSPTFSWLVFNLVGGTFVWSLWTVPSFLKVAHDLRSERAKADAIEDGPTRHDVFEEEERFMLERSFTTQAEAYAIPTAVAIGFVVPSIMMLVFNHPAAVLVWLFFPIWVATVHWIVMWAAIRLQPDNTPLYLESHPASVIMVYIVPFAVSLVSHAFWVWTLFYPNDGREMTLMALKFIKIDFSYIAATVFYWLFIESGPAPAVMVVLFSLVIGPGAALCLTWLVRERAICAYAVSEEEGISDDESDGDNSTVHEDTPLLH